MDATSLGHPWVSVLRKLISCRRKRKPLLYTGNRLGSRTTGASLAELSARANLPKALPVAAQLSATRTVRSPRSEHGVCRLPGPRVPRPISPTPAGQASRVRGPRARPSPPWSPAGLRTASPRPSWALTHRPGSAKHSRAPGRLQRDSSRSRPSFFREEAGLGAERKSAWGCRLRHFSSGRKWPRGRPMRGARGVT